MPRDSSTEPTSLSRSLRIAVVSPYKVWPPNNGGRALVAGGCEHMVRAGASVRCFALHTLCERNSRQPPPFDYVERCAGLSAFNALDRLRLSKIPFLTTLKFYAPRFARWAQAFGADLVEVHMPWLMGIRRWLPGWIPVVYHAQNVEADWYEPILASRRFPGLWSRQVRRMENRAVRLADRILTLTSRDASELARRYGVPMERITSQPPGIEVPPPPDRAPPARKTGRRRAAFCGSRFSDNVASALRIIRDIAPACRSDWDFEIAGGVCGELRREPVPDNVRLLGFVDDLVGWLRGCDVFVHPVQMQTGINMKLSSALAARLPIVATADGARGFESFLGGALRVVAAAEFPKALQNPHRWSASDEDALQACAWPRVIEERLAAYRQWIADARAEPRP
ncbi:MAG: glycosyltransferase family 4 protein [Kiritimatiellae bacterium]|nr:glycosyltransferase family 4 protein [Kiritimatiellia bacterium]